MSGGHRAPTHMPRKRFGQHFLHDPAVIAKIVDAIDPAPGDRLVEIGGGHGALTLPLRDRAGTLEVVEIDRELAAALATLDRVTVHSGDVLDFDFAALAAGGPRLRIVGNLPYNISTPILFRLLEAREAIADMHLMLQKEVAVRICARPGGRDYGRLTVMLAPWLDVVPLFDIGAGAFRPPPKVRSSVIRAVVRRTPRFDIGDEAGFARIVAKLFSMRRKTIGRILKDELDPQRLAAIGIDPKARPETLAPADFARLAANYGARSSQVE